jgi:hypothetical protein
MLAQLGLRNKFGSFATSAVLALGGHQSAKKFKFAVLVRSKNSGNFAMLAAIRCALSRMSHI